VSWLQREANHYYTHTYSVLITETVNQYDDGCLLGCCEVSLEWVYRRFRGACCLHHPSDNEGSKHLWNVGKLIPVYTKLQPRRQPSSYSPPWERKISPNINQISTKFYNILPCQAAEKTRIWHKNKKFQISVKLKTAWRTVCDIWSVHNGEEELKGHRCDLLPTDPGRPKMGWRQRSHPAALKTGKQASEVRTW
jgi:hypothetical protein